MRGHVRRGRGRGRLVGTVLVLVGVVVILQWQAGVIGRWAAAGEEPAVAVEVVHVIDGDTLIVERDGSEERVRLLGIDAPETARQGQPGEPCADEATALTQELIAAAADEVEVISDSSQPDEDRYGRTLAYVEADGQDVSAELLRAGLAEVYESAPDIARYADYEQLAARAVVPACEGGS